MWIAPTSDLFVIDLTNRVHPDGHGEAGTFAAAVRAYAARAFVGPKAGDPPCPEAAPAPGETRAGIDVLAASGFKTLAGARVGLLTNAMAAAKDGPRTIDVLARAPDVSLVAIFTPEHGLGADREGPVADAVDGATGIPVRSLYKNFQDVRDPRGPGADAHEDLFPDGIDTLVVDLQDVGVRFYTYAQTMRRAMRAAAARGVRVVVLDRPNPLGDVLGVDGPVRGFPVLHGMTMGELSLWFDAEDHAGSDLTVVRLENWQRNMPFDATGLVWHPPSPNLRTFDEALLYPVLGLLEATNVSVGRGTDHPFELLGAPWIDEARLAALLEHAAPGLAFAPTTFVPSVAPYKGELCHGVRVTMTERGTVRPTAAALAIAQALEALFGAAWHEEKLEHMLGSPAAVSAIALGAAGSRDLATAVSSWTPALAAFRAKREKYLLYPSACSYAAPPAP
jgi:uncharacterized protein YbbC (DUF1343 family)